LIQLYVPDERSIEFQEASREIADALNRGYRFIPPKIEDKVKYKSRKNHSHDCYTISP
jgi:hypothetical protein